MEKWTPKQVSQLVGGLGSADCWKQYAKIVVDEELDGLTFLHISQGSLVKMGFRAVHAEAIVNKLRSMSSSPHPAVIAGASPSLFASPPPAYSGQNNNDGDGMKKAPQCKAHNEPFQGYCVQDQQLVCVTCIFKDHRGHVCESINDVFARMLSEMIERSKRWLKAAEDIAAMRKEAQVNNDRVVAQMERFFNAVEKRIRERKDKLRSELKGVMEEKLRVLTKQEQDLRSGAKVLARVDESVKQFLQATSAVELQSRADMVEQLLREGVEGNEVTCEPQCDVDVDFTGDIGPIGEMIDRLGELHDGEWAVASECEAIGPGLETVRADQQTGQFIVISKNAKGEVLMNPKVHFQVRVASGNTDKLAQVVQSEAGTITYQINSEKRAKELNVSVLLRGEHIKGSPFNVKIQTNPPVTTPAGHKNTAVLDRSGVMLFLSTYPNNSFTAREIAGGVNISITVTNFVLNSLYASGDVMKKFNLKEKAVIWYLADKHMPEGSPL